MGSFEKHKSPKKPPHSNRHPNMEDVCGVEKMARGLIKLTSLLHQSLKDFC